MEILNRAIIAGLLIAVLYAIWTYRENIRNTLTTTLEQESLDGLSQMSLESESSKEPEEEEEESLGGLSFLDDASNMSDF